MAEEECTHFSIRTHTLAEFLIDVAASHGAHSYSISCSIFFFQIQHLIFKKKFDYKFSVLIKFVVENFPLKFQGSLR
jgi:hypothetical protein